jgi:hypothetical protein
VWSERCEIHGNRLVERVVTVRWGYDSPETRDRDYLLAEPTFRTPTIRILAGVFLALSATLE